VGRALRPYGRKSQARRRQPVRARPSGRIHRLARSDCELPPHPVEVLEGDGEVELRPGLLLFVAALVLAALVVGALLLFPAQAQARWSRLASKNVRRHAAAFEEAAEAFDLPAPLLAAVAGHETHCQGVEGRSAAVWGPMQVAWGTWGPLLSSLGVATREEDLLDVDVGVLAGAAVIAELRRLYPGRSLDLVLCLYGVGSPALLFERDCRYSRAVLRQLPNATRALWGAP